MIEEIEAAGATAYENGIHTCSWDSPRLREAWMRGYNQAKTLAEGFPEGGGFQTKEV